MLFQTLCGLTNIEIYLRLLVTKFIEKKIWFKHEYKSNWVLEFVDASSLLENKFWMTYDTLFNDIQKYMS